MAKRKKIINTKPLRIKTGDMVIVISGEDRGATPRQVLSVLPKERRLIVEGVNVMKDRQKQSSQQRSSGINQQDVIEKPFPIHAAKVMLADPKTKKPTRVRISRTAEGVRQRVAAKSGEAL